MRPARARSRLRRYGIVPDVSICALVRLACERARPGDEQCVVLMLAKESLERDVERLMPALYGTKIFPHLPQSLQARIAQAYALSSYELAQKKNLFSLLCEELAVLNVTPLVLKGLALSLLYYRRAGRRVFADIDIAIPPAQLGACIARLNGLGFTDIHQARAGARYDAGNPRRMAVDCRRAGDGAAVDVHVHILAKALWPDADGFFWNAAEAFHPEGLNGAALTLSATDHLLHVCLHGISHGETPSARWLLDAAMILNSGGVDSRRIMTLAAHYDCPQAISACLDFLVEEGIAQVDAEFRAELARMPQSRLSDAWFLLHKFPVRGLCGVLISGGRLMANYRLYVRALEMQKQPAPSLAAYLKRGWESENTLSAELVRRAGRMRGFAKN